MPFKTKTMQNPKIQTAQEFVNVEDIADNILFSHDGYIFGYLFVRTGDEKLMSEQEQQAWFENLTQALENSHETWQLLSIPRTVDTAGMLEHLMDLRRRTDDDAKLRLLNGEISAIQDMAREGAKEPIIVLKCWQKAAKGANVTLKKRLTEFKARLQEGKVYAEILEDKDIVYICKIFADLTEFQEIGEETFEEDIPIIENEKRYFSKKVEDNRNNELLNIITPVGGLEFKTNRLIIGGVSAKIYGATRYPSEMEYGWAVSLMNSSDSVTSITFVPKNANELADALSKSIKRNRKDASSSTDARDQLRLERQTDEAADMIKEIDERKESIGMVSILTMPFTSDEEQLDDVCRSVVNRFAQKRIKLKIMGNLQKQAYQQLSPYYVSQPDVDVIVQRLMPLYTLSAGSPMTINTYRDDKGYYFAKTKDGNIISLDFFYRGNDRTNSNIVIMGMQGKGKSTALKSIMETLYMSGVKILVIDPEREFLELCIKLNGTWLDAGGGNAKFNIFQIRPVPVDDDDEKNPLYKADDKPLVQHMKTLEIFFQLYIPSLTDLQKALLKKTLVELYEKFNITWDTDITEFKPEAFPIFSDLYNLLKERATEDNRFEDLAALLYDISEGADGFLWNGHSNIDVHDSNFVCFDTNRMVDSSEHIKRTQYFNILTMCWELVSRDRTQPVALFCDEAYLMIDPNIPQSLFFLRNFSKRCRKYEGLLAVVSHAVVDFLDERIKMYGQALLDSPTYKILFGTDGQNLKETAELYKLTEPEQNILLSGIKKKALCIIGSQKIEVTFDIPQYKLDLMGTSGGR